MTIGHNFGDMLNICNGLVEIVQCFRWFAPDPVEQITRIPTCVFVRHSMLLGFALRCTKAMIRVTRTPSTSSTAPALHPSACV